ncbi:MAG: hypothetical protein A3J68_02375 [Candidatus Wildermuthbacteria bacterium RIFCSPHIGHO2_02_FULL_48_16]|uniref:Fibronectin type-III domain-containing protein n=1 Tax=Candidatus Wildermuthbacteria bacterium RIFCSPHIGHO2_02_FULL_48_16 TaxID=1802453 RepID=A0A1G2R7L8_9BACT|nr:MAG: hypothetical protein A3J68_02375 [Candidatus Wildermuthbacteria bacterium RIFCSPHIGHO2_02_FULL_48_16]
MRFLFFLLFVTGVIFLLPQEASALLCSVETGWKVTNIPCDIKYTDSGGGTLAKCLYRVDNNGTLFPTSGDWYEGHYWASAGTCSGLNEKTLPITLTVGAGLNCAAQGQNMCKLFAKAIDNPNNEQLEKEINNFEVDYTKPTVSANNQSSQWFTSRQTTLSVSDVGGSNLVEKRWNWNTDLGALCNTGGTTFDNGAVLPVPVGSNRLYLCAVDGAGNQQRWDSGANQYRVDNSAPKFTAFNINGVSCEDDFCPGTVTAQGGTLTFAFKAIDNAGASGLKRYELWRARDAAENSGKWVWEPIQPNILPATTSTTDTPPSDGTWWYGMHAVDNTTGDSTGNCITEAATFCPGGVQSDNETRTVRGPMKVMYGDQIPPTIDSFSTVPGPTSWVKISSPNAIIKWDVYDSGTGTLNRIEIWRARDNSGDQILQQGEWNSSALFTKTSGFDGPSADIDQYTDTTLPVEERIYWYGIHVVDNANNTTVENAPAKVRVDKIAPGAPTLVSPINNITITNSKPTFDWNDVTGDLSGISSYNIRVNNTPNFNNLEIDTDRSTSFYASDVSLGEGNQYWWVRATDGAGNQGGDSIRGDFQIDLNQPPNASFNCSPGSCTVFNTETLTFNNNSTDPDGSGDISKSEWDILSWGTAPDATCTSPNALCDHTLQPITPNTYTMQLKAQDAAGTSDTDTKSFTVKRDIVAGFMCSLDNVNFVACTSLSGQISQEEVLYLKDSSSLSEYTVVSQGASSVNTRTWKINGSIFGGNSSNPSTPIPTQGTITLELTAQDNQGRSDTQTHTLNPQVPFPEFQEISPF